MPRLSGFKIRRQPSVPAKDANGTLSIVSLAGTYKKWISVGLSKFVRCRFETTSSYSVTPQPNGAVLSRRAFCSYCAKASKQKACYMVRRAKRI